MEKTNFHQTQTISQKEILSFKEAVLYLSISESLLYKLVSMRKINHFKPNNGKLYFKKMDLDKWMLQNEVKSVECLQEELIHKIRRNGRNS